MQKWPSLEKTGKTALSENYNRAFPAHRTVRKRDTFARRNVQRFCRDPPPNASAIQRTQEINLTAGNSFLHELAMSPLAISIAGKAFIIIRLPSGLYVKSYYLYQYSG